MHLIERIRVILHAAPTYLTAVALICGIVIAELPGLPFGVPAWLTSTLAGVAATVTVAAIIIRRVTPVLADARGILPNDRPATAAERDLVRQLNR